MEDPAQRIMPITYMNSAANLKAFVGEHGGTVCTSSNAEGALSYSFDVEDAESADVEALGAEGAEISVPARGSVRPIVRDMLKHLCSAISYGGANSLSELQEMFRGDPKRYAIRLTEASRRESFDR